MSMISSRPFESLIFMPDDSERVSRIVMKEVDKFFDDTKQRYLSEQAEASLAQVKEQLLRRGITESEMEYQICDFSETLTLVSGEHTLAFSRPLFPKDRAHTIKFKISNMEVWKTLQYSAENIAEYTKAIIDWIPNYKSIVANAEVEVKRIQKICEIGMAFLQTLSEKLCQHGLKSHVYQSFDGKDCAIFRISYGSGISCEYQINLLDDFQEKFLEITDRLCH